MLFEPPPPSLSATSLIRIDLRNARGRERQRECYKTTDSTIEYNIFAWMCVYEIIKLKYLKLKFQINCPCDYTFFVVLHIAGVSQYLDKIFTSEL